MKKMALILVALAAALFLFPRPASAQTCSATISSVDFGAPSLLASAATDVTATVAVTCTNIPLLNAVKLCPGIEAGSGGADASARLLTGPSGTLRYQLYQDAARTQAWGSVDNATLGTVPAIILSPLLSGSATATRTLYARLFGGQASAAPGSYRSSFTGNATMFTYATALLGASSTCTGFVGTATIRPTFTVGADPAKGCTITAGALTFPATGILRSPVTAQSQLAVTCTSQTGYSIQLDAGRNPDAGGTRRMKAPSGSLISYQLFRDAARTAAWAGSTQAATGTGTGSTQQFTVYGRVPAQLTPEPATYSDTVVVTVTY
ncbi:spore coat U domain-containing protein [Sphingomonas aracearum]|uniref:Spore coat protein U/FanG domain-containing protein n=1 Tax=Sphingomonas aracearum TaxID=2283317 RepID=A0A369VXM6_9SPHN|nr:spore coat U domain-containing protein [Sphingomonas aracearum]RDE07134.1 hypothetical protein DVW87_05670 [Sphingomonas aracearum]